MHVSTPAISRAGTNFSLPASATDPVVANLEFGLIPPALYAILSDKQNLSARENALEELNNIVIRIDKPGALLPHVPR